MESLLDGWNEKRVPELPTFNPLPVSIKMFSCGDNLTQNVINAWESIFAAVELLDSIGHVSGSSIVGNARDGFVMNDTDNDIAHDLPL